MRPAQKAPENPLHRQGHAHPLRHASMRPAQKAPENLFFVLAMREADGASMRPAQKAPENRWTKEEADFLLDCFNEAGAKSAGKRFSAISTGGCPESLQ